MASVYTPKQYPHFGVVAQSVIARPKAYHIPRHEDENMSHDDKKDPTKPDDPKLPAIQTA